MNEYQLSPDQPEQEAELQELNGVVQAVLFSNEENGYTVLRLRDGNDQIQTMVGCFPHVAPGETILATGSWIQHPTYGRQFRADFSQRLLPTSSQAVFEFLASGAIKGIREATATLIVNTFGAKSLDVLEHHPEKLTEIRGISLAKAKEFSEILQKQTSMRNLVDFVCAFSCRPVLAVRLYKFYGDQAMPLLQQDPYLLTAGHIGGFFSEADNMALELGFAEDCTERVRAAVVFELIHNLNNGHCFIPEPALTDATCRLISVREESVSGCIEELIETGQIVREEVNGTLACYLPEMYRAETYIAQRLVAMDRTLPAQKTDSERLIRNVEQKSTLRYAPAQRQALLHALGNRLFIITGGPGTGKSTITRAILDLFDACGYRTILTAPTGKAAKRMEAVTGREASTVHRLLGAHFDEDGDKAAFSKNEDDPLECDAVILDESSMVDLLLMEALLRAMPPEARLIMVGDEDQLPPVGPGYVFRSILRSNVFPMIRLTEIFRQAGDSMIVSNAHMINKGQVPDFSLNQGGFFRMKRLQSADSIETITELCASRLPERMHIPSDEIQVLSPTRRGELGTQNLNRRLQQVLNPPEKEKKEKIYGESIFREGDRVMQIRNNYDLLWHDETCTRSGIGIYNGDIGVIRKIDTANETLEIDFEGKIAIHSFSALNELEHAWAITVHKSQGCEFRAVILALSGSSRLLLTRSILYTAITRARELLILVGDESVARAMIANEKTASRFSYLKRRILEAKNAS